MQSPRKRTTSIRPAAYQIKPFRTTIVQISVPTPRHAVTVAQRALLLRLEEQECCAEQLVCVVRFKAPVRFEHLWFPSHHLLDHDSSSLKRQMVEVHKTAYSALTRLLEPHDSTLRRPCKQKLASMQHVPQLRTSRASSNIRSTTKTAPTIRSKVCQLP